MLRIEAVGEADGQYVFCTPRVPSYATSLYRERTPKGVWPNLVSEDVNPLGGLASAGELSFSLLDVDDEISGWLATDGTAYPTLLADVTRTATSLEIGNVSGAADSIEGDLYYLDREAIRVDTHTGGTSYDVTRGHLDTLATAHNGAERSFHNVPRYLLGRRVRVYVVFDKTGASSSDEREISSGFWLEAPSLDPTLNAWQFTATSQARYFDRLFMRRRRSRQIETGAAKDTYLKFERAATRPSDAGVSTPSGWADHFGDKVFLKIGDEIVRIHVAGTIGLTFQVDRRGVAGTTVMDQIDPQLGALQVYVAGDDAGSFRYQARGLETSSRSTGTWVVTTHPIPILLALLTSPSDPTTDVPDNWTSGEGNYSALPAGVGLGVPATDIDWTSFHDVWQRTETFKLEHFALTETGPGRSVLERVCRLCGYSVSTINGLVTLNLARAPEASASAAVWDADVLIAEETDPGVRAPRLDVAYDADLVASHVVFTLRTAQGTPIESVWSSADFPQIFGTDGYDNEDQRIEIDASDVRGADDGAMPEVIRQRALQLLYRFRRPVQRVSLPTDWSQEERVPHETIELTHPQVPDRVLGTRGVAAEVYQVVSKGWTYTPTAFELSWGLARYGVGGLRGRVGPAARVVSVVTTTVTVDANRYTDPDSNALPDNDPETFLSFQVVRAVEPDGTPIATVPATTTVASRTSTTLVLGHNWSAYLSAGDVIVPAYADEVTAAQRETYAFQADEATLTPGATGLPFTYGEP